MQGCLNIFKMYRERMICLFREQKILRLGCFCKLATASALLGYWQHHCFLIQNIDISDFFPIHTFDILNISRVQQFAHVWIENDELVWFFSESSEVGLESTQVSGGGDNGGENGDGKDGDGEYGDGDGDGENGDGDGDDVDGWKYPSIRWSFKNANHEIWWERKSKSESNITEAENESESNSTESKNVRWFKTNILKNR